jgi:hypothetical protein
MPMPIPIPIPIAGIYCWTPGNIMGTMPHPMDIIYRVHNFPCEDMNYNYSIEILYTTNLYMIYKMNEIISHMLALETSWTMLQAGKKKKLKIQVSFGFLLKDMFMVFH